MVCFCCKALFMEGLDNTCLLHSIISRHATPFCLPMIVSCSVFALIVSCSCLTPRPCAAFATHSSSCLWLLSGNESCSSVFLLLSGGVQVRRHGYHHLPEDDLPGCPESVQLRGGGEPGCHQSAFGQVQRSGQQKWCMSAHTPTLLFQG